MISKAVLLCIFYLLSCGRAEEGIIVSGGTKAAASVEIFIPSTGETCSLPRMLQGGRYSHTMDVVGDGVLVCGGGDYDYSYKTCHTLEDGRWVISHDLTEWRALHNSWVSGTDLLLIGGWYSPYSSEVVTIGEDQGESSFSLEQRSSYACSIPDLTSPSVILTGGYTYKQAVSRYDRLGFVEELPSLIEERVSHGCGAYLRQTDGIQVLLVTGGHNNDYPSVTHSSTEVLIGDAPRWEFTSPLPRKIWDLKGVTLGGTLYMTGGEAIGDDEDTFLFRDEVIVWHDDAWVEVGKMSAARVDHAATNIDLNHPALEYCV